MTEIQESKHLILLQSACQEFAMNKELLKELDEENSDLRWIDNNLEIEIDIQMGKNSEIKTRRRSSLTRTSFRRRTSLKGTIDLSLFKIEEPVNENNSRKSNAFSVDLTQFQDEEYDNRDSDDSDEEYDFRKSKAFEVNLDEFKGIDFEENNQNNEDILGKMNFSKKKKVGVNIVNTENKEENSQDKQETKILSGLSSLINGGDFKKLIERKSREKAEEEKRKKEEIEQEEERLRKIQEEEKKNKMENINIDEIDKLIEERERPTFKVRNKFDKRGSLKGIDDIKILSRKINSVVPIKEIEVDSDTDYSFDSDKEEKEETPENSELKKPKVNLNKFGEEVGIVIENLEKVYTKELQEIMEPVTEQMKSNLHFSMVEQEDEIPNFRLENINEDNLFKIVKEKYGEISVVKSNKSMGVFIIGTANKNLLAYYPQRQGIVALKTSQKKYPTCIEFNPETEFFVVGYSSGEIAFYKNTNSDAKNPFKRILRFKDLEVLKSPIKCLKIFKNTKAIIASLEDGRLFYMGRIDNNAKLERYNFNFRLVENGLSNSSVPQLTSRNFRGIDFVVQTLGHTARVYVHKYSAKFKGMEKIANILAPEGKSKFTVESFPFFDEIYSDGAPLKVICIHWGFDICYYSMYYGKGQMHIPLAGKYPIDRRIDYVGQFEKGVYAVLTEDGGIYHYFINVHAGDENSHIDKNLRQVTKTEYEDTEGSVGDFGSQLHFTDIGENEIFEELERELVVPDKNDILVKSDVSIDTGELVLDQVGENYINKISSRLLECVNSQLVFVSKLGLKKYSMINWIDYLKIAIDETKIFFSMKTLNDILDLKLVYLREIPKEIEKIAEDIRPMFTFLIVKIWTHAQNYEENLKELISKISMLLLLKAGMEDFILETLKGIMIGFGYSNYYYENLYLFYLNNLIRFIDESVLVELMKEFKDTPQKRIKLLYHAYRFGDLQEFSLQQALVNRYYNLMVYFCCNDDPSNSSLALNFMVTDLVELNLNKNLEQASNAIYSIFWYINKICIEKRNTKDTISKNERQWLVLSWLYDVRMAKELVEVDIVKYLGCINYLIQNRIGEELDKLQGGKEFIEKNKIKKVGILSAESSDYLGYLLDSIYNVTEEKQTERIIFYLFLASLILIESRGLIKVSQEFKRKTLFILLDEYKEIGENSSIEMNEEDIILIAISLFLKERTEYCNDSELKEKLKTKEKKIQVITHILNNDYKSAFTQFQRNIANYNPYNSKLFEWLSQGLECPNQRQPTLDILAEEYIFLIKTNHVEFSKVIENLTIEEQMDFIMKYKPTTKSKLQIFKNILNFVKTKHKENDITEDFKIEYINLLNIYEPKQVLIELLTGKYPMSECLKICEESKNMLPVAYLKERLGFFKEALEIYKERLTKCLNALTKGKRNEIPMKREKLVKRMENETNLALNLCENAENSEKLTFDLMEFFIINTFKYPKPVIQEWKNQSEKTLFYLIKKVKAEKFIETINSEEYNFIDERDSTTKTMNHFKGLRNMLLASRYVNGYDFWQSNGIHFRGISKGVYSEHKDKDFMCLDSMMLFKKCSHTYAVNGNRVQGQPCFCKICEECDESFKCHNVILRSERKARKIFYPDFFAMKKEIKVGSSLVSLVNNVLNPELNKRMDKLGKFDKCMDRIKHLDNYMVEKDDGDEDKKLF